MRELWRYDGLEVLTQETGSPVHREGRSLGVEPHVSGGRKGCKSVQISEMAKSSEEKDQEVKRVR